MLLPFVKADKRIGSPDLKGARGLHLGVGHDQGALDEVVQYYGVDVLRTAVTVKRHTGLFQFSVTQLNTM